MGRVPVTAVLIDTCVALWAATEPELLSEAAKNVLQDPEITCYMSSVSIWEVGVKYRLGKINLPVNPREMMVDLRRTFGFSELEFGDSAAILASVLPLHHRDPFDRMLLCQALDRGLPIVSPDERFLQYPVRVVW